MRVVVTLFCLLWVTSNLSAQSPFETLVTGFEADRKLVPAGAAELVAADAMVERAKAAQKSGNTTLALRLLRDARRILPVVGGAKAEGVNRIFGSSRLRHGDRITGLSISPDNQRLASSSRDRTVRIWDVETTRELLTYKGHLDEPIDRNNVFGVPNVLFSPDGKLVASSGGKTIHLWNPVDGKRKTVLADGHTAPVRALAFLPDGKTLVTGGDDRKVVVWDLETAKPKFTFPEHVSRVEGLSISHQGRMLAVLTTTGQVTVYPLGAEAKEAKSALMNIGQMHAQEPCYAISYLGESGNFLTSGGNNLIRQTVGPNPNAGSISGVGNPLRSYGGHTGKVYALATTADGTKFVTGASDRTVRIWDTATGRVLGQHSALSLPAPNDNREMGVSAVAIARDGSFAVSGTVEGAIQFWPIVIQDEHLKIEESQDFLWSVAVSPDGKRFASAGVDKVVRVYDAATTKLVSKLAGHQSAIPTLTFLGNDKLVTASGDRLLKLWDLKSEKAKDLVGHQSAVLAVAVGGERIFSGGVDKTVRVWDAEGASLSTWTAPSIVMAVAVMPAKKLLLVGTADGMLTTLRIGDKGELTRLGAISAHGNGLACITSHPDGQRLLTVGGDGLGRFWDMAENGLPKLISRLEPRTTAAPNTPTVLVPLSTVAVSPDGRTACLAGSDGLLRLWNLSSVSETQTLRGHTDWITSVAFTPNGQNILATSVDKTVRVFEIPQSTTNLNTAHTGPVTVVAVSPNGERLATAGRDTLIKIWSLKEGQLVANVSGSTGPVTGLSWMSDDKLVSCSEDGRIRWWNQEGKELQSTPTAWPPFMLFSNTKSGQVAVAASDSAQHPAFELFDASGKSLGVTTERNRKLTCATISQDLTLAASASDDGKITLWNLKTKAKEGADWPLFETDIRDVVLSSDGKTLIAVSSAGQVKVATTADRAAGKPFDVGNSASSLALSPAGDQLAVLFTTGQVKLYSLEGKLLKEWKLGAPALSVGFHPKGQKLYVGLNDGTTCEIAAP
ncbi:MAG: WD40 repeat domain-containing protein [Fimbriiglobus sp.]